MDRWMLSEPVFHQLKINHARQEPVRGTQAEIDHTPACLLRIVGTDMWWMLSELDGEIAFGLCQIQCAELGSVWMPELADLDVRGLRVTLDENWRPEMTLGQYAKRSRENGWWLSL